MNEDAFGFLSGVATMTLVMIILVWSFRVQGEDSWQKEAVEAGHAHYYLDENNDKQFKWNDPCSPKPMELPCGTVLHK